MLMLAPPAQFETSILTQRSVALFCALYCCLVSSHVSETWLQAFPSQSVVLVAVVAEGVLSIVARAAALPAFGVKVKVSNRPDSAIIRFIFFVLIKTRANSLLA